GCGGAGGPARPIDPAALARHARLLPELLLGAARAIAADPPVLAENAAEEEPAWLAPLRPEAAPHATWSNFSVARADVAADAAPQPTGAKDAAATQARLGAGLAAFERVSAREALHR